MFHKFYSTNHILKILKGLFQKIYRTGNLKFIFTNGKMVILKSMGRG